jgi:hypothetical protein
VASGEFTRAEAGEWLDVEMEIVAHQLNYGRRLN